MGGLFGGDNSWISSSNLFGSPPRIRNLADRLKEIREEGKLFILVVDGELGSGKSYFGKWFASTYDKDYKTLFTTMQLINALEAGLRNHFLVFDEIQLQASSSNYMKDFNEVIRQIIGSFRFLYNHLILTCPNVGMLDKGIRGLISYRATVVARKTKDGIKRVAYIRKPYWSEKSQKWKWSRIITEIEIPDIVKDEVYEKAKEENFFLQLSEWKMKMLRSEKGIGIIQEENEKEIPDGDKTF